MAEYIEYLRSLYTEKTSARKLQYIEYNFGKYFATGSTTLEVGPGLGEFLAFLRSKDISDIDVVDRDEATVNFLRSKFDIQNAWIASAENLDSISSKLRMYDQIFMLQIMEHVETAALPSMLKVLYDHLKPGGVVLITVPNGGNPLSIVERYSDITHTSLFSENSLRQLSRFADLKDSEIEVHGYRIPPVTPVDWALIVLQKTLHLLLKALLIVNGGVHFSVYEPNITLVIRKKGGARA